MRADPPENQAEPSGVPIEPETLRWAMRRAKVSEAQLAKAVAGGKIERVRAWLEGSARPTHAQTHRIAAKLDVPFPVLLGPPPPPFKLPVSDFRRPETQSQPSPELEAVLLDALRKRDWYRAYRQKRNPYVGKFANKRSFTEPPAGTLGFLVWHERDVSQEAAYWAEQTLELARLRKKVRNWTSFRAVLAEAIEDRLHILVLLNSMVGNNIHRPLDPEEFAGFALADPIAPLIFVNTRGSVARSIFTLAHELGHILLREDALDSDPSDDVAEGHERFCNRFAAELLMPEKEFRSLWRQHQQSDIKTRCTDLARTFFVSSEAVLIRAHTLDLISDEDFERLHIAIRRKSEKKSREGINNGGNFWANVAMRNSKTFFKAVIEATRAGELTYTSAARLLNVNVGTLAQRIYQDRGRVAAPE